MNKNSTECITCSRKIKMGAVICAKCVLKESNRQKADVFVPGDYLLSKDDYVLNGLAFLHACNALKDFIEKIESDDAETLMKTWSDGPCIPEKMIEEEAVEKYEFFYDDRDYSPKKIIRYSLKTPIRK